MKKAFALLLSLAMIVALLSACGDNAQSPASGGEASAPVHIDTLQLMFVPSHDAQETLAAVEPFGQLLRDELAKEGFEVDEVTLSVGESYEAVGEALANGSADIGVGMPGGTYVQFDDACEVILTATRDGLSKDSDNAKDWNDEMPTVSIDRQTVFYRSLIIAGPSETGKALAEKVNGGEDLTWEDLDAATWSVMGTTSSAGYIYPALWLMEHYGKSISDLSHTVQASSYDEAYRWLASGEVDVLLTYADARRGFAEDWNTSFGREESIWGETNVIGVTPGIYNDTITVSKSSAVMSEAFVSALQNTFIHIAENTAAGQTVISIYNHKGYQKAVPADYDNERAAQQLLHAHS